jgi:hypothetical protein
MDGEKRVQFFLVVQVFQFEHSHENLGKSATVSSCWDGEALGEIN